MQDVLKQLNDRNPSDVRILDERALRRFEGLCEAWAKIAEVTPCPARSVRSLGGRCGNCEHSSDKQLPTILA
jgi:hypothetical protein